MQQLTYRFAGSSTFTTTMVDGEHGNPISISRTQVLGGSDVFSAAEGGGILPDLYLVIHLIRSMKVPFILGVVGHFGLTVRDPKRSAKWFHDTLGLEKQFAFENGVAVGNDNVTIALFKGKPSPGTIDHMSFHLPDMKTLRKALAHLKEQKVNVEDPGEEIGPEAPGSPHMGLWFHDPDGYRWELSVQNAKD